MQPTYLKACLPAYLTMKIGENGPMLLPVTLKRHLNLKVSQCPILAPNGIPCNCPPEFITYLLRGMINKKSLLPFISLTLDSSVHLHTNLNMPVRIPADDKFHMLIPNDHTDQSALLCQR